MPGPNKATMLRNPPIAPATAGFPPLRVYSHECDGTPIQSAGSHHVEDSPRWRRATHPAGWARRWATAILVLAWGHTLTPTAHANPAATATGAPTTAAPSPVSPSAATQANTQRLQVLEQRLYQAFRYIEGLSRELETVKAGGAAATPGAPPVTAAPGPSITPGAAAPPPGTQHALRAPAPETPEARAKRRSRLEEQEEVASEQERPELQPAFLRQARAVLIPKGRLELEPSLQFTHSDRNRIQLRGLDLVENIFIGTIELRRIRRNALTAAWSARYGLTDRVQLNLSIPYSYNYSQDILSPELQRELGEEVERNNSNGDLGDISFGVSVHALRESEYWPDVILSANFKSDTGTSPFDISQGQEIPTGTGFWGLRSGFTMVKVSDPAVIYLSGGYFYHHKDDIDGDLVFGTTRIKEVDPPDSFDWGVGISYAMNPYLSLTTSFSNRFVMKTAFDDTEIDGSDQTIASLNFGVTYAMGRRSSMDLQIGVGLTDDTPDFSVRLSTPMVFSVPQFWENWGNWRLSRLFRF